MFTRRAVGFMSASSAAPTKPRVLTIRPESRAGFGTDAFNRELARATPAPPGRASERIVTRGVEIHTDGSNPSLSLSHPLIFRSGLGVRLDGKRGNSPGAIVLLNS